MDPLYRSYGSCGLSETAGADAPAAYDLRRRFGAVARLYGEDSLMRFGQARIGIVGIGGVGTWVAEALARSGVGNLTLIDMDHVSESNTNRQIHALDDEYGKAKVQAMAQRIRAIHPGARVIAIEDFITPQNVATLVSGLELVVDCIDELAAKAALLAHARDAAIAVVSCGAAGGRTDPGRIRHADLAFAQGDALLANVRHRLRREYGFPPAAPGGARRAERFGIEAVFSDEPPCNPPPERAPGQAAAGSPLACGGYGSAVTVTASMGFTAAARVLASLQPP